MADDIRPLPPTIKVRRDPKCYGGGAIEEAQDGAVFIRQDIAARFASEPIRKMVRDWFGMNAEPDLPDIQMANIREAMRELQHALNAYDDALKD